MDNKLLYSLEHKQGAQTENLQGGNFATNFVLLPHLIKQDEMLNIFRKVYSQKVENIIRAADDIRKHRFNFLGSGSKASGDKIDWHKDFKSGHVWDKNTFYKDIKYGWRFTKNADVIIPWELSRFQHLFTLGKAYWLTGDEKYSQECVYQINDWIDENPTYFGVNWVSPMDVAIRAVNWITAYHFFYKSQTINTAFIDKFFGSLTSHALYLYKNIKFKQNNNHRIAGYLGLLYLGLFLSKSEYSKKWTGYAVDGLIKAMKEQVYPDGVDYEGSIYYHKLVTELFLISAIVCKDNKIELPKSFFSKLEKMLEFIVFYTTPNGVAPHIGDSDDGRLYILSDYYSWDRSDHRYLLSAGAVFFKRGDFASFGKIFHEESFWLFGMDGYYDFHSLLNQGRSIILSSRAYPYGGYYIMRHEDLHMIIDCLPVDRKALTGHRHNSRLSFEIAAYNKSFIVDPGTYGYTSSPEWRNKFRSTAYHNTAIVDKVEQNDFDEGNLFWLSNSARININKWESNEECDLLDIQHLGYQRSTKPVVYRRMILFNKADKYWVIVDKFSGKGDHSYNINFHFNSIKVGFCAGDQYSVRTLCEDGLNICINPISRDGLSIDLHDGWVSPRYGIKVEAPILGMGRMGYPPQQFVTLIYPFSGDNLWSNQRVEEIIRTFLNRHQDCI